MCIRDSLETLALLDYVQKALGQRPVETQLESPDEGTSQEPPARQWISWTQLVGLAIEELAARSEKQGQTDADRASWDLEAHIATIFGDISENPERKAEFAASRAQLRRALEMMSTADSDAEELRAELKALQSSALHTAQAADKAATSRRE